MFYDVNIACYQRGPYIIITFKNLLKNILGFLEIYLKGKGQKYGCTCHGI